MMTRKDYVRTAEILSNFVDLIDDSVFLNLVNEFCDFFLEDNPNFVRERFYSAIGIE
jgi:hypothetical protein